MGMASPLSFELLSNAMKFALFYHNKKKVCKNCLLSVEFEPYSDVINIAEVSEEIFDDVRFEKRNGFHFTTTEKYSPLI